MRCSSSFCRLSGSVVTKGQDDDDGCRTRWVGWALLKMRVVIIPIHPCGACGPDLKLMKKGIPSFMTMAVVTLILASIRKR